MIVIIFFSVFPTIWLLNYSLDYSKPVLNTANILETDIQTGVRMPVQYVLDVELNGEVHRLNVPKDLFFELHAGDEIIISKYRGFFHFEYYVIENSENLNHLK